MEISSRRGEMMVWESDSLGAVSWATMYYVSELWSEQVDSLSAFFVLWHRKHHWEDWEDRANINIRWRRRRINWDFKYSSWDSRHWDWAQLVIALSVGDNDEPEFMHSFSPPTNKCPDNLQTRFVESSLSMWSSFSNSIRCSLSVASGEKSKRDESFSFVNDKLNWCRVENCKLKRLELSCCCSWKLWIKIDIHSASERVRGGT